MRAALVAGTLSIVIGAAFAWRFMRSPVEGGRLMEQSGLIPLRDALDNGLYVREWLLGFFGRQGFFAALKAAAAERRLQRFYNERVPLLGAATAQVSAWFDNSIVDGARYRFSELWWLIRRGHQRLLQTGFIQHYMLIILLSAVLLCIVILKPLGLIFAEIFARR
jgi:hypothetical protein